MPRFCSDAARLRGDDNAGTAARVDVWILVEFPGPWGRNPLNDAALPEETRNALREATRAIPRSRVVFIKRRSGRDTPCRVYVVRSAPFTAVSMVDLPSIEDVWTVPFTALAESHDQPEKPLVLVCTHGQHDSCCGRRGIPLYAALACSDALDVWQCSHIGGDRFAANALVLPWGIYYGPVEPGDAGVLTETILANEIYLPGYRGRSSMGRISQAAETFVRRNTGIRGRTALRIASREQLPDGAHRIVVRDETGALHEVTLEEFVVAEEVLATCSAKNPMTLRQLRMREYRTLAE